MDIAYPVKPVHVRTFWAFEFEGALSTADIYMIENLYNDPPQRIDRLRFEYRTWRLRPSPKDTHPNGPQRYLGTF